MSDDFLNQLLSQNSLRALSQPGSVDKPIYIACGIRQQVNTTAQLANPGVCKADNMIQKLPQGRPGVAGGFVDKMLKALQSVPEEVRKMAANVKIEGSLPAGTTVASNAPMVGGGPSGGYEGPSA